LGLVFHATADLWLEENTPRFSVRAVNTARELSILARDIASIMVGKASKTMIQNSFVGLKSSWAFCRTRQGRVKLADPIAPAQVSYRQRVTAIARHMRHFGAIFRLAGFRGQA
jgi:hypothetical protein